MNKMFCKKKLDGNQNHLNKGKIILSKAYSKKIGKIRRIGNIDWLYFNCENVSTTTLILNDQKRLGKI